MTFRLGQAAESVSVSGRTPVQVECRVCGVLWASLGAGAAFTQPPADLFARHAEQCQGKMVLATRLRGPATGGIWFDMATPSVVVSGHPDVGAAT